MTRVPRFLSVCVKVFLEMMYLCGSLLIYERQCYREINFFLTNLSHIQVENKVISSDGS